MILQRNKTETTKKNTSTSNNQPQSVLRSRLAAAMAQKTTLHWTWSLSEMHHCQRDNRSERKEEDVCVCSEEEVSFL